MIKVNNKIKVVIGSWYIFKLIIIKKRDMTKKGWEPLLSGTYVFLMLRSHCTLWVPSVGMI